MSSHQNVIKSKFIFFLQQILIPISFMILLPDFSLLGLMMFATQMSVKHFMFLLI